MLLAIDVGNTNVVMGFMKNNKPFSTWRINTKNISTEDELSVHLKNFLDFSGYRFSDIEDLCVASVVPSINDVFKYYGKKYMNKNPVFVKVKDVNWINWNVWTPNEIGADRIANVIGAKELYRKDVIIVDFGTAVTIDILTDQYEGGTILPGPRTAIQSLFTSTAKLPSVEARVPDSPVGKDTVTNIQSGVMIGTMFAIDGLISLFEEEFTKTFKVISTGGYGQDISKMSTKIGEYVPDLTLQGISLFYSKKDENSSR
jgi:type III pantothenate kinase|uniref:Type III pantothenate kinase n=1 Tax=Mesoaciditoga lauensis TaxID=1495039 RepID=A0A7V3RDF6_9BACT